MYKYRFTIVTVCYNAEKYIQGTILSLLCQDYDNYEYIIKDGGSTDKTMSIIHSLVTENDRMHIVSTKDKGIYDAMNCAANMAQGEYIYFLNAGDSFCNERVLVNADQFIGRQNYDIVFGNVVQVDGKRRWIRKYRHICSTKFYFLTGDCICHQALFSRRKLFEEKKFDTRFRVCADKEWQMYNIISKKIQIKAMPIVVANFMTEGYSKNHIHLLEKETQTCLEKYFPHKAWVYRLILNLKKNQLILKLFKIVEKIFFTNREKDRNG